MSQKVNIFGNFSECPEIGLGWPPGVGKKCEFLKNPIEITQR
jgi:hypothetical protein